MISYKKINLMGLSINCNELFYDRHEPSLIIKSPIIIATKDKDGLILKINNYSDNHGIFMNVCGYINTLYNLKKIGTNIIINNTIIIKNTDSSKFFDENKNNISFSKLKDTQKIVCSFNCSEGCFLISQCLLIN